MFLSCFTIMIYRSLFDIYCGCNFLGEKETYFDSKVLSNRSHIQQICGDTEIRKWNLFPVEMKF